MAFRLLDKTAQGKMFAAPIGVIKAGRNRIGAVGQLDVSIIAKAPGGPISISWAARNDDTAPGTVGLALLDGTGALFARTDGVILSPGEERTLNLNVPEEQVADPYAWADKEVWTIAMIAMAWEDAPDPKSGDFTNLAYSSPAHTFTVDYTDAKQKLFTQNARAAYESAIKNAGLQPDGQIKFQAGWRELLTDYINAENLRKGGAKERDKDFAFYIEALEKYGLADTDVVYSEGWRDVMTEFLQTRDTRQTKEAQWLADLEANGLNKDELSFADWQAGKMQDVVNARAQKTVDKEEHDKWLTDWSNFQMEMLNAGISFKIPAFTSDWRSTLESTRTEYEDRRAYKTERVEILKDNPALASRSDIPEYSAGWRNRLSSWTDTKLTQIEAAKTFADKTEYMKARNKAGFSSREVSYSANWRSTLSTAKSKRISDNLRAETKKRQDKIAADAKVAREAIEEERRAKARLATELQKQRDKDKNVLRRALLALRQQQTDTSDVEWTPTPSFATPRAGDVPGLTTPAFAYTGKQETARENNRLSPVFVSPFVVHERVPEGTARVVETSSGNFLTVFDHQATGEGGDLDDWI